MIRTLAVVGLVAASPRVQAACVISSLEPASTVTVPMTNGSQSFRFVATNDCVRLHWASRDMDQFDAPHSGPAVGSDARSYSIWFSPGDMYVYTYGSTTLTWSVEGTDAAGNVTRVMTTNELDFDHDGWTRSEGDVGVCDEHVEGYPGAIEICDGIDNDCNGETDEGACSFPDLSVADAVLTGRAAFDVAGESVAGVGDVDGDGHDDLLVGTQGRRTSPGGLAGTAYLVLGPVSGSVDLELADAALVGHAQDDGAGVSLAGPGDIDGDGHADLLIGALGDDTNGADAGVAYIVMGPVTGRMDVSLAADARLLGEASNDIAGYRVAGAGDANDDGLPDLLVGASGNDASDENAGAAYRVLGPVSGDLDLSSADSILLAEAAGDAAGLWVAGAGDVDGDGLDDALVGAQLADGDVADSGAAYLVLGGRDGTIPLGSADAKFLGEEMYDGPEGMPVAGPGDVDGDGHDDVLVGAPGNSAEDVYLRGAAYLVLGPVSGELDLAAADAKLIGETRSDELGMVAHVGDLDADGNDDLLVSAAAGGVNSEAGAVYVVLGPVTGTHDIGAAAAAKYVGIGHGDHAGYSLDGAGDVDGDGTPDVIVGAPYVRDADIGPYVGAAYLLYGGGL